MTDRAEATRLAHLLRQKARRLSEAVRAGDIGKSLLNAVDLELAAEEVCNLLETPA